MIEDQIKDIAGSYNHIKKLKDIYLQTIKDKIAKQNISKLELFNESKLKIKLSKFSGYNSKLDVLTPSRMNSSRFTSEQNQKE